MDLVSGALMTVWRRWGGLESDKRVCSGWTYLYVLARYSLLVNGQAVQSPY
jgi:hypothetical protein